MAPKITLVAERACAMVSKSPVQILDELFEKITLDIIFICLLGYDLNCLQTKSPTFKAIEGIKKSLESRFAAIFPKLFAFLHPFVNFRFQKSLSRMKELVESQRKKHSLLDHLAQSNRNYFENVLTFILAGHDTSSSALTSTFYLLMQHPEYIETIRKVPELCVENKFAVACFIEAIRLYPPAAFNVVSAVKHVNTPIEISEGNTIILAYWNCHKGADFQNADTFNPHRWNDEFLSKSFFGFGGGPRACPGRNSCYSNGI